MSLNLDNIKILPFRIHIVPFPRNPRRHLQVNPSNSVRTVQIAFSSQECVPDAQSSKS